MVLFPDPVADAVVVANPRTGLGPEGSPYATSPTANCAPPVWEQSSRADPWVRELFRLSERAQRRRSRPPQQSRQIEAPSAPLTEVQPLGDGATALYSLADTAPQLANPLVPLRDRDCQALSEFFAHAQMAAIEADIAQRLSYLFPEPSWDTEPYEFLREFL